MCRAPIVEITTLLLTTSFSLMVVPNLQLIRVNIFDGDYVIVFWGYNLF